MIVGFAMGGIAFWMPITFTCFAATDSQGFVSTIFGAIVVVAGRSGCDSLGRLCSGTNCGRASPGSYFLVSGLAMLVGLPFSIAIAVCPLSLGVGFHLSGVLLFVLNTGPTNTILANVSHPSIRASAFALNILVIHALGDVISRSSSAHH